MSDPIAAAPVSPWAVTFAIVRRRWGRACVRVTMLADHGPEAFCALAVQPTTTGTGAAEVASAFGPTEIGARRALVMAVQGRSSGEGSRA